MPERPLPTRLLALGAALGVVLLAVAAFALWRSRPGAPPGPAAPPAVGAAAPLSREAPTESEYERSVRETLAPFLSARAGYPASFDDARAQAEADAVRRVRDRVLAMIVPASMRDYHFSLVRALTEIGEGIADRSIESWKKGEDDLDAFLKTAGYAAGD